MKIVIDIDEEYYNLIRLEVNACRNKFKPYEIIANGIPLPEHHGRLIEELMEREWKKEND